MKKLFTIKRAETTYWDDNRAQKVWSEPNDDDINIRFGCADFPPSEDMKIGRDLFDADDYLCAIMLGFRIANAGYEGIHIIMEDWPDDE